MKDQEHFFKKLRNQIAQNSLEEVFEQLKQTLEKSPNLNEVLLQSAQHADITSQIRKGIVDPDKANLTKNQIRNSLLELLDEMENPIVLSAEAKEELSKAISLVSSKQVFIGSNIQAGRDIKIGDTTYTETKTSRNLRIILFILVPLLAILGAYLWYQNQVLQKPFSFKVKLQNQSPNDFLPEPEGTLRWIDEESSISQQTLQGETTFEGRNPKYRKSAIRLQFEAAGFEQLDTLIIPKNDLLLLPVQRDGTYARLQGIVSLFGSEPSEGVEGVEVSISCCSDTTDANGKFSINIPLQHQRKEHRVDLIKQGYRNRSTTEPVSSDQIIRTYLEKE